jgi:hypothetical protein
VPPEGRLDKISKTRLQKTNFGGVLRKKSVIHTAYLISIARESFPAGAGSRRASPTTAHTATTTALNRDKPFRKESNTQFAIAYPS